MFTVTTGVCVCESVFFNTVSSSNVTMPLSIIYTCEREHPIALSHSKVSIPGRLSAVTHGATNNINSQRLFCNV